MWVTDFTTYESRSLKKVEWSLLLADLNIGAPNSPWTCCHVRNSQQSWDGGCFGTVGVFELNNDFLRRLLLWHYPSRRPSKNQASPPTHKVKPGKSPRLFEGECENQTSNPHQCLSTRPTSRVNTTDFDSIYVVILLFFSIFKHHSNGWWASNEMNAGVVKSN